MSVKFEIKNRFTGNVQFTADIKADEDTPLSTKIGFAVKWAIHNDVNLHGADLSGADLHGAYLRGADLHGADLRRADLHGAYLRGADLHGADLRGADLHGVNLRGADLSGADLRGADLRGVNLNDYIPKIENIHQRIYEAASKDGALDMSCWHKDDNFCGTTHCRAGWVVHLAGEGGRVLEGVYGTSLAAALIYYASDPALEKVPDFYCDNETALADMKRLAGVE